MKVTGVRILGVLTLLTLLAAATLGLLVSPADRIQGESVRLMYIHVPTAWVAYVSFAVTAVCSLLYLIPRTRRQWLDHVAAGSAEVGVAFIGLTLLTGSLWGRLTWGTYWVWDARLTSTALLFVMFLGYLAVRRTSVVAPEVRARRAAVVGLIAALDVPVVHKSVEWWRSLHQDSSFQDGVEVEGTMLSALLVSLLAFSMLYAWLVTHRYRVARLETAWESEGLEDALVARRAEADRGEFVGAD